MTSTEIKTIELIVNSEQARKRLDELNDRLSQMRRKREEALEKGDSRGLQVYAREIRNIERELERTESRAATMSRALAGLDRSTPDRLRQTLRELTRELNSGKVRRGSAEWEILTKAVRETKESLSAVNRELSAVERHTWADRLSEWGNKWMGLVMNIQAGLQLISGARQVLQQTVSDFAHMEEAEAAVRKYTGLSREEVKELNGALKQIDTRTARERLNELAGDAGKLGITATDRILEFVDAADQINVALGDDLGNDAVKNIGKLAMMFGEDDRLGLRGAMLATGSTINELSQNSSAAAGYLEQFTARLSGVGRQAGLSQADIMGFGAVLDENMQASELASTAFSQLTTKMFQKPAKFAALAGLEVKKFSTLLKTDANAALLEFFESMRSKGGFDALAPMFSEMGLNGVRATGVLSAVADKLSDVREMQKLANEAYEEATSVTSEFNIQNTTVQAGLDKARKSVLEMRVELGEKLQPVAANMLNLTTSTLRVLSSTITFVGQHRKEIISLAAAIATYNAVVRASMALQTARLALSKTWWSSLLSGVRATRLYQAASASLAVVQGLLTVAFTLFTKGLVAARLQFSLLTAAMMKNPLGLVAVALSVVVGALLEFTGILGSNTDEVERSTRALQGRRKALADNSEAGRKANAAYEQERQRLGRLHGIVQDGNRSLRDRQEAINKLQAVVPGYHASLTQEGKLTERNTEKIREYLKELKQKALAEALYEKIKDSMAKKADADLAAATWDRGVKFRERQMTLPGHESRIVSSFAPGAIPGQATIVSYESNKTRRDDERLLAQDKERREYWQNRSREEEEYVKTLLEYAKKQGAATYLENLIATGGKSTALSDETATGGGTGGGAGSGREDPQKKAVERLEAEALARRLYAQLQYRTGILERREYEEQLLIIEQETLERQQGLYAQGSQKWNELQEKRYEQQSRMMKQYDDWSLHDIGRQEQEEIAAVRQKFLNMELTEKAYREELSRIRLDYLRRRRDFTALTGSEEAQEYADRTSEEEFRQQMERRQEYLEQAESLRKAYFKKSLAEQEKDELALLARLTEEGIVRAEETERFKTEIAKKYAEKRASEEAAAIKRVREKKEEEDREKGKLENPLDGSSSAMDEWSTAFVEMMKNLRSLEAKLKDGEACWQDYAAVAIGALSMISAVSASVATLYQAQQKKEEQAVEERYEKEIQKAGENTRKGKQLEEQKQKEVAKVKNKYNSKAMAVEMAQAVASTAMAAINAYASASKTSWLLGPVAAALALAAGAVQIAAIRKQHAAQESSGYYAGGFTGGTDYRREAGIVHQGEFVASHEAVGNPALLPVLRLIDYAQRNNTVASLTAANVSRTLGAPSTFLNSVPSGPNGQGGRSVPGTVQVVQTDSGRTAEILEKLNRRLEEPIETFVTIDGPNGLHRQYEKFRKMLKRK